jgi:hypothetical protein
MEAQKLVDREKVVDLVEKKLPDFVNMVKKFSKGGASAVILHQDAFAADYQSEELILFGAAIKYAGMHGVPMNIIGGEALVTDEG